LIETDQAVQHYFNSENKAAALYKMDDVYDRIENIVESVSLVFVKLLCTYTCKLAQ